MANEELLQTIQDDAEKVLPIYIAVDHSWSMSREENNAIDAANTLIPSIIDTCLKNPDANARARFCIVGFNNDAEVMAPLSRGPNLAHHTFDASGGTEYSKVFKLLRSRIESDYVSLKSDDAQVYRPSVFLITDGEPLDEVAAAAAFAELTDANFTRHPNVFVFGLGPNVTEAKLKPYVSGKQGRVVLSNGDKTPAKQLDDFIGLLMASIVNSTSGGSSSSDDDSGFDWDEDALDDFDMGLGT